jgi:Uma2 family endonuclease
MTLDQQRTRRGGHKPVHYPSSDGKPMAETDLHRDEMVRLITTLQNAFADRSDVYVSGNLLLYYVEGDPRRSVAPDVFVVFGIAKHRREIYKLWEEKAGPAVVIEVTSRTTRREDLEKKRDLYARLGVREYYLYDPRFARLQYLDPPLQGLRLEGEVYRPMATDADGALISEALGMRLHLIDRQLRLFDAHTGALLLSPAEQAEIQRRRADAAERRIAELEALLRERGQP